LPVLLATGLMSGAASLRAGTQNPLSPEQENRARTGYMLNCAGCHQPNGRGAPGSVPDLHEYLGEFAQHPEARSFLARVPGASGAPISDADLAGILNWILITMNAEQLRPGFAPYTAEEVARYRADPIIDVEPLRAQLIVRLAQDAQ
jgi:mono/diheme cytochrome c family protein